MTENERLAAYAAHTNAALDLAVPVFGESHVVEAMRYSLLGAGKRIRAALVLEFARLCGVGEDTAMPFACAVEMIHAYSLIHDDLPCMDDDDFRRGKPSCHKRFGEACALLAGDALLTLAFETAALAPLPGEICARAVGELARAAGYQGMVGGQIQDLEAENHRIPLEALQSLYGMKTGALLRVSALLGCLAGQKPALEAAAKAYTDALGITFQITDDILDVTGSVEKLGKPIGSDAGNRKTTYVTLLGLDGARLEARRQTALACEQAKRLPDSGFLLWLADMVLTRDH